MARKIIWSVRASLDKDEILKFWLWNNQSATYPRKLNQLFHQTIKLLAKNPLLGRKTTVEGVRAKLIRDYLVFYRHSEKTLEVLVIWDAKRNPAHTPFEKK
jgi:toxin YoeB